MSGLNLEAEKMKSELEKVVDSLEGVHLFDWGMGVRSYRKLFADGGYALLSDVETGTDVPEGFDDLVTVSIYQSWEDQQGFQVIAEEEYAIEGLELLASLNSWEDRNR